MTHRDVRTLLAPLPAPVRDLDLLELLRAERIRPTPVPTLADFAGVLLRGLSLLRDQPPTGRLSPPELGLTTLHLDDPELEEPALGEAMERRLLDLLDEIEAQLERRRRVSRIPPGANPLLPFVRDQPPVRRQTRDRVAEIAERLSEGAETRLAAVRIACRNERGA